MECGVWARKLQPFCNAVEKVILVEQEKITLVFV